MERSSTFDQVEAAYFAMKAQAKEGEDGITYWQGALTNLLEENGIPKSRYSHITGYLKRMGCIEALRRGAGPVPSVWILHDPPERAAFEESKITMPVNPHPGKYRKSQSLKMEEKLLRDINDRLLEVERRLERAGI